MRRSTICASAILSLALLSIGATAQTPTGRIPPQTASDLNGRTLSVPGDLGGKTSLWMIAFGQEQQPQVDRLLALVATLQKSSPGLQYWVVPVIEDPGSVVRFIIDTGMKTSVEKAEDRARFVTLYVQNQDEWRRAAGLTAKSEAVLAVVAADGAIVASRPQSAIKDVAGLKAFVNSLPKRP